MKKVTTAVFPVAGIGSRFLPVTKACPKEMLPIMNKPLIQYAVAEAVKAGITHLVFVTSSSKGAIEDYFDSHYELEGRLQAAGKLAALNTIKSILPANVSVSYVRQAQPRGLGHAVLCAKNLVGNEPFAVLLADDFLVEEDCLRHMVDKYQHLGHSVLGVEPINRQDSEKYGMVALKENSEEIANIIEKPQPEQAPSNLGVIGRYVLSPNIFALLEKTSPGAGNEIQLTDAIADLLLSESVCVHAFSGKRFDCGSQRGYLQATLHVAQQDPELKNILLTSLQEMTEDVCN